jgi:hypothetical protein
MTSERMARLVARWVRFYTRDLPDPIARRRADELQADLHDHIADERARGTGDREIARSIAARMLRGAFADVSWRIGTIARSTRPPAAGPRRPTLRRSALRIALPTAAILLVPLIAMQLGDAVRWSVADFVLAGALLVASGLLLDLAGRRPATIAFRAAAAVLGVAAIAFGLSDDAPGLVLFGCLLIGGTMALALRTAWRGG